MEFKGLQLHCIQSEQQFGRPLKTQAPFSPAGVNEEILNPGRPDNPPLALQFSPRCVCARGDPLRLVWANGGGESAIIRLRNFTSSADMAITGSSRRRAVEEDAQ